MAPVQFQGMTFWIGVVLLALGWNASAATLARWDFNSRPPDANPATGTIKTVEGEGKAKAVGKVNAQPDSYTWSDSLSSDPETADNSGWRVTDWPPQGEGNKQHGIQFNVSTRGYRDIAMRWDLRASSTASRYLRLQYTINGSDFIDFRVITVTLTNWYNGLSASFADIPGVADNPKFGVRFVAEFESTAASRGSSDGYLPCLKGSDYFPASTIRFDMVTFTGEVIPPNNLAYAFNGSNQYIELPTMTMLETERTGFTIEAWVKLAMLPADLPTNFAGIFDSNEDACVLYLDRPENELRVKFTTQNGALERPGISGKLLATNVWFHVAGVYDPADGSASIYLNGVLQDTQLFKTMREPLKSKQTPAIGCNFSFKQERSYFFGSVDELRLWATARRAEEILINMYLPVAVNPPPKDLFAYYQFDHLRKGLVPDLSPHKMDGKIVGSPDWVDSDIPLGFLASGYTNSLLITPNVRAVVKNPETGLMMADFGVWSHNSLTGVSSDSDQMPSGFVRAERIWQVVLPPPHAVPLVFDRAEMGAEKLKGDNYVVLKKMRSGEAWSIAQKGGVISGDEIHFKALRLTKGFYTVAAKNDYAVHYYSPHGKHVFPFATPANAATNMLDALNVLSPEDSLEQVDEAIKAKSQSP